MCASARAACTCNDMRRASPRSPGAPHWRCRRPPRACLRRAQEALRHRLRAAWDGEEQGYSASAGDEETLINVLSKRTHHRLCSSAMHRVTSRASALKSSKSPWNTDCTNTRLRSMSSTALQPLRLNILCEQRPRRGRTALSTGSLRNPSVTRRWALCHLHPATFACAHAGNATLLAVSRTRADEGCRVQTTHASLRRHSWRESPNLTSQRADFDLFVIFNRRPTSPMCVLLNALAMRAAMYDTQLTWRTNDHEETCWPNACGSARSFLLNGVIRIPPVIFVLHDLRPRHVCQNAIHTSLQCFVLYAATCYWPPHAVWSLLVMKSWAVVEFLVH